MELTPANHTSDVASDWKTRSAESITLIDLLNMDWLKQMPDYENG